MREQMGVLGKRRVIQVAIGGIALAGGDDDDWTVLALCDDSTIWFTDFAASGGAWILMAAVPGTEGDT
jgi:hypothetical protein